MVIKKIIHWLNWRRKRVFVQILQQGNINIKNTKDSGIIINLNWWVAAITSRFFINQHKSRIIWDFLIHCADWLEPIFSGLATNVQKKNCERDNEFILIFINQLAGTWLDWEWNSLPEEDRVSIEKDKSFVCGMSYWPEFMQMRWCSINRRGKNITIDLLPTIMMGQWNVLYQFNYSQVA